MQRLAPLITLLFLVGTVQAQSLKKYPVSNSGCSVYSYCEAVYEISKSEDSSTIYSGECAADGINYGTICVKLLNPINELDLAEEILISYSNYLKESFDITKAVGYGKGHRLNNNENTRGILDYWEDKDKNHYKIKAWTNGKYIGFQFVYSQKDLPEPKINAFLDGFRLPQ